MKRVSPARRPSDTEDAATLVANWRAPFDNNLKGKLPGGFDAIAIDELRGADTDGTAQSKRVCAELKQLRELYPTKRILTPHPWGAHPGAESNFLSLISRQIAQLQKMRPRPLAPTHTPKARRPQSLNPPPTPGCAARWRPGCRPPVDPRRASWRERGSQVPGPSSPAPDSRSGS